MTADIVFALDLDPDDSAYDSLPLKGDERIVAVAPRPWFEHEEEYMTKMAWALDRLVETHGVTPVFVPMEPPYDTDVSKRIVAKMEHGTETLVLDGALSPNELHNFIARANLTIALRLHALIFSALQNVPHVGLSYDPKVEAFLKRSGMWEHSFPLGDFTKEALYESAAYALDHSDELKTMLAPNVGYMRSEAIRNIDLLREQFLDGRRK